MSLHVYHMNSQVYPKFISYYQVSDVASCILFTYLNHRVLDFLLQKLAGSFKHSPDTLGIPPTYHRWRWIISYYMCLRLSFTLECLPTSCQLRKINSFLGQVWGCEMQVYVFFTLVLSDILNWITGYRCNKCNEFSGSYQKLKKWYSSIFSL